MDIKEMEGRLGPRRMTGTLAADLLALHREQKIEQARALLKGMNQAEYARVLGIFANAINELIVINHEEVCTHLRCHQAPDNVIPTMDEAIIGFVSQLVEHADHCDAAREAKERSHE